MDQGKNQSGAAKAKGRLIDFGPSKHPQPNDPPKPIDETKIAEAEVQNTQTDKSEHPAVIDNHPAPVTSAQAAINAMYANQPRPVPSPLVSSAREAVNAAQGAIYSPKTAANLHHGKIQRNMESTRTSASALIKRGERKVVQPTSASVSGDPLSHYGQPAPARSVRQSPDIPVVRTSLKLGANARPKQAPVVLPANAKMAHAARPVGKDPAMLPRRPLSRKARQEAIDAQVIQPDVLAAPHPAHHELQSGVPGNTQDNQGNQKITVDIRSTGADPKPNNARPRTSRPTMNAVHAAAPGQRFRTKPKDFATNQPKAMPVDSSYVMTEPPKIRSQRHDNPDPKPNPELGVVEDYYVENAAEIAGDKAPLGQNRTQFTAPTTAVTRSSAARQAHVPIARPEFTIKEENTSNYSFSQPKDGPDNNRYALGGQSPFIKTTNIEKRPLSDNFSPNTSLHNIDYERTQLVQSDAVMPGSANSDSKMSKKERKAAAKAEKSARKDKLARTANNKGSMTTADKPVNVTRRDSAGTESRSGRKNRYTKKIAKQTRINPRPDLPARPTVIVPASRRSRAPLFFLIVLTIILGAAVGGAVYLCFFQ